MGIQDRDYYQEGGSGEAMPPVCKYLIIVTVIVFLLQIFVTRPTTPADLQALRERQREWLPKRPPPENRTAQPDKDAPSPAAGKEEPAAAKPKPRAADRKPSDDRESSQDDLDALVDRILEKIQREGQSSLTDVEREVLRVASRRYRGREKPLRNE